MKLVSKTHDYYDAVFKTSNFDDKYVFVREEREVPFIDLHLKYELCLRDDSFLGFYNLNFGLIGFCGEIHPFVYTDTGCIYEICKPFQSNYFYNTDDLNKEHPEVLSGQAKLYGTHWSSTRIKDIKNWLDKGLCSKTYRTLKQSQDLNIHESKELREVFEKHRVSYFAYNQKKSQSLRDDNVNKLTQRLELYPQLQRYQFFKVYDTYTAFQKIEHHQTNELVRPDMIEHKISDKLKAETHGFDKWSFRKESKKK